VLVRQEEEDRRSRPVSEVSSITQDESVDEDYMVDDEGVQEEREIWEVTHVSLQELETTESEVVDFLSEPLELAGWSQVNDMKEKEKDVRTCLDYGLHD
jgi:hypothetical protein